MNPTKNLTNQPTRLSAFSITVLLLRKVESGVND